MPKLLPPVKVGAHVEVFKRDPQTGEQTLVHTSRPCEDCGLPLDGGGLVVPREGDRQVHAVCPTPKENV